MKRVIRTVGPVEFGVFIDFWKNGHALYVTPFSGGSEITDSYLGPLND